MSVEINIVLTTPKKKQKKRDGPNLAIMNRVDVGVREQTVFEAEVPDDPRARLMYYLSTVSELTGFGQNDPEIRRLTHYSRFAQLTAEQTDTLLSVCAVLKPDVLLGKVIFKDDDDDGADCVCREHGEESHPESHRYVEISAVRRGVVIAGPVIVSGRETNNRKLLLVRRQWLADNWAKPMRQLLQGKPGLGVEASGQLTDIETQQQPIEALEIDRKLGEDSGRREEDQTRRREEGLRHKVDSCISCEETDSRRRRQQREAEPRRQPVDTLAVDPTLAEKFGCREEDENRRREAIECHNEDNSIPSAVQTNDNRRRESRTCVIL